MAGHHTYDDQTSAYLHVNVGSSRFKTGSRTTPHTVHTLSISHVLSGLQTIEFNFHTF